MATTSEGLICGLRLDGQGKATLVDWDGVTAHWDDESLVWVHLDCTNEAVKTWLRESSGLDPVTAEALVSEETRPRCLPVGDGLLVNLRGVNFNPGADPDDMVSLRMWVEHNRLITLRREKLLAVEDVRNELLAGKGPKNAVGLLLRLAERLIARAGETVAGLDEAIDALEEEVLTRESHELRGRIAATRRTAIGIRRYLSPQRDAMNQLWAAQASWIQDQDRGRLRELADRVTRYVEDLDSIRDRAAVTQEELNARLAEQTNRTMYVLSVVAGIFLPLGLLTGLLGINVGGMPGTENPDAFWNVCFLLVAITVFEIALLRRQKWF